MKNKKKNNRIKSLIGKVFEQKKRARVALVVVVIGGVLLWKFVLFPKKADLETTEIKKGIVSEELILSGEINADEYAELVFQSSGKIAWVGASEGEWVRKGQALAKLNTTNLNADLQRARSDLRDAEATVERVHDDVKDHAGDETFTQKETRTASEVAKDKAYEAVLKAEENLRNATLTAPFAGLVTYVANPFSGLNILYSQTQFELVNPESIYFEVSADQTEVTNLSLDQKVKIILDSYIDQEFEGEITFISYTPKTGEVGAVYKVKVSFPIETIDVRKFRIGMTGDAKFILSDKSDVLYVPPQFVNSDTKGRFLRLGSKNNKTYIEVGLEGEERVEVSGEIKEGDTIYD